MEKQETNRISRIRIVFLHLRLPFSYFLLPVFVFALSQSTKIEIIPTIIIFISLHFFIYPASNAYNSFMDKDKGSIGALKNPPPVSSDIYKASILFDISGLLLMLLIDFSMIPLLIIYIFASKAYSWTGIRLKKYPVTGWLIVILFQGAYTFLLVSMVAENTLSIGWFNFQKAEGMLIASLLIGAYYPLTQVYQHDEDSERGDFTISYRLGIAGTFIFSAMLFLISFFVAFHYFNKFFSIKQFYFFGICIIPAILFFMRWFILSIRNKSEANFRNTMRMTLISSTCLLAAFLLLLYMNHFNGFG